MGRGHGKQYRLAIMAFASIATEIAERENGCVKMEGTQRKLIEECLHETSTC